MSGSGYIGCMVEKTRKSGAEGAQLMLPPDHLAKRKEEGTPASFERIAIDVAEPFSILVNNLACRFGVPLDLHCGQGRNFEPRLF